MVHTAKTFCTTREAAQLLGVSVTTAQNWSESGLLEFWRTEGGHRRISRASVERLLASPSTASGISTDTHPKTPNILWIEAESAMRNAVQQTLSQWQPRPTLHLVNDGFSALMKIGAHPPDLLVMRYEMAHIDTRSMLLALAQMPACQNLPVLVLMTRAGHLPSNLPNRFHSAHITQWIDKLSALLATLTP